MLKSRIAKKYKIIIVLTILLPIILLLIFFSRMDTEIAEVDFDPLPPLKQ